MRIIDSSTVEVAVGYTEPTVDADSTPNILTDNPILTDLSYTSLFYRVMNPDGSPGTPVAAGNQPAASPRGGGPIKTFLLVPAPMNQITILDFWVTATDLSGNTSAETHGFFTVDRMPPSVPTNFLLA